MMWAGTSGLPDWRDIASGDLVFCCGASKGRGSGAPASAAPQPGRCARVWAGFVALQRGLQCAGAMPQA
jgi:hypothetical protein